MRQTRLLWQLYAPYLVIIVMSTVVLLFYAAEQHRAFYYQTIQNGLEARAVFLRSSARQLLESGAPAEQIQMRLKELGEESATRLTLIAPDGTVLADSAEEPSTMDNHRDRSEIAQALRGETGVEARRSGTLNQKMMYVALPLWRDGEIAAVVRTAYSIKAVEEAVRFTYSRVIAFCVLILLIAAAVSFWVSKKINRPLENLRAGAQRFARGDFGHRLPVSNSSEEIAGLAEAMNTMAEHLSERIRTIVRERNEKEAVLSSMVEGVLAIDNEERIIHVNDAAANLLNVQPKEAQGRLLLEVLRNPDLEHLVEEAFRKKKPVSGELIVHRNGVQQYLFMHGTILTDPDGNPMGGLVVLNDVTQLRRLEKIRRDFVANVSHELRTPITSIKGFIETLQEGALHEPEQATHFLDIIARQSNRLNSIVEDLLSLSRLEGSDETPEIECIQGPVAPVINSAIQTCLHAAQEKSIEVKADCPRELRACMNAQLLEEAVVNLVSNAIKYSPDGSTVFVRGVDEGGSVGIEVQDQGCGISEEHLGRVFERFYRVDKARSRKLGGTGLGLAIVKHIALAHGGSVDVRSDVGQGSTFTIHVPQRPVGANTASVAEHSAQAPLSN